jgi:MFS family permease
MGNHDRTSIHPPISFIKSNNIQALVFIGAFSIGCGCAQTIEQLIAFRALQGIGGAGLYSMAMIVLPEITPPNNIPVMSGLIGGVTVVSAVLYVLTFLLLSSCSFHSIQLIRYKEDRW